MDRDGKSVWVFERCGKADDGCAKDPTLDPVLKFDSTGKLVTKSIATERSCTTRRCRWEPSTTIAGKTLWHSSVT